MFKYYNILFIGNYETKTFLYKAKLNIFKNLLNKININAVIDTLENWSQDVKSYDLAFISLDYPTEDTKFEGVYKDLIKHNIPIMSWSNFQEIDSNLVKNVLNSGEICNDDKYIYIKNNHYHLVGVDGDFSQNIIGNKTTSVIGNPYICVSKIFDESKSIQSIIDFTNNEEYILINFTDFDYRIDDDERHWIQEQIEILIQILLNMGNKVIVTSSDKYDRKCNQFVNKFQNKNVKFISSNYSIYETMNLIRMSRIVIDLGTKLCNIAVSMNKPFISIGYDINYLDLKAITMKEDMFISVYEMNVGKLIEKIEKLDSKYDEFSTNLKEVSDKCFNNNLNFLKAVFDSIDFEKGIDINSTCSKQLSDYASNLNKVVAIFYYGRSGSLFFQSLLDNHPEVIMIPGSYIGNFYDIWDVCEQKQLSREEIINVFLYNYDYLFDAQSKTILTNGIPRGVDEGFANMGENRNEVLGVDKEKFIAVLKEILSTRKHLTRKFFFQAMHVAYTEALGRNVDYSNKRLTIVFGLHWPLEKNVNELISDFEDAKLIHTIRNPIQSLGSVIKDVVIRRGMNNINTILGLFNNILRSIPVSKSFIDQTYLVKLEDLHNNSIEVLKEVCKYIDIKWEQTTLLESTFDGEKWWNVAGAEVLSGFTKKTISKTHEDLFSEFDKKRLECLLESKYKSWGYKREFNDDVDYEQMKQMLQHQFKFEKIVYRNEDKKKCEKLLREFLNQYWNEYCFRNERLDEKVTLIGKKQSLNNSVKKGTTYWITGLSGAGKTTIGKLLYTSLRERKSNIVFLDGDNLREIFGGDLGYSLEDRKKSAMRNARLCKELSDQGIDVICATISMFNDCRQWNRENIDKYKEIYIKVPMNILIERDQKGLYSGAVKGEKKDIMGIDIEFEEPKTSDIVILNDGMVSLEDIIKTIIDKIKEC